MKLSTIISLLSVGALATAIAMPEAYADADAGVDNVLEKRFDCNKRGPRCGNGVKIGPTDCKCGQQKRPCALWACPEGKRVGVHFQVVLFFFFFLLGGARGGLRIQELILISTTASLWPGTKRLRIRLSFWVAAGNIVQIFKVRNHENPSFILNFSISNSKPIQGTHICHSFLSFFWKRGKGRKRGRKCQNRIRTSTNVSSMSSKWDQRPFCFPFLPFLAYFVLPFLMFTCFSFFRRSKTRQVGTTTASTEPAGFLIHLGLRQWREVVFFLMKVSYDNVRYLSHSLV